MDIAAITTVGYNAATFATILGFLKIYDHFATKKKQNGSNNKESENTKSIVEALNSLGSKFDNLSNVLVEQNHKQEIKEVRNDAWKKGLDKTLESVESANLSTNILIEQVKKLVKALDGK